LLSLRAVRKSYGGREAVSGLSIEVKVGEVYGLLGPNGAGKTTTIGLATGLLTPEAGEVEIRGLGSPSLPRVRARLGVAPQALALYEGLTGEENVALFGTLFGLGGRRRMVRVAEAIDFVGLHERKRDLVKTYSGGMKRRLNLAVAIVHEPDLVLLDEPTVGVDPQSRHRIFENILALRARSRTIVYTTHYLEEAERLCDRVGIVDHGKLLAEGTVSELVDRHGRKPVLVAQTAEGERRVETDEPLDELNRLARTGPLLRFHVERPGLEQVFLHLTGRGIRD
jgi:linearmycin/streptolysin S transport system ATP-binding protein